MITRGWRFGASPFVVLAKGLAKVRASLLRTTAQSVRPAPEVLLPPTHVVTPGVAQTSVPLSTHRGFWMAWVVWAFVAD